MRRSICYSEPNAGLAGEVGTWKFIFTTASTLPKNSLLRFDMQNTGRSTDWEIPQVNLKKKSNVIYMKLPNGKILEASEIHSKHLVAPQFQFRLPQEISAESSVTIFIGEPPTKKSSAKSKREHGNQCQHSIQRRRHFFLYVDPTGKGNFKDPEVFNFDIKGNVLHTIRVMTPSFAVKNKRFDVVLRFEDEYGNLTANAPDDTLIELSHENLRENLRWKLFVPETGFIMLPNLYFNEPGIYHIKLQNMKTKESFYSSPIKCFQEESKGLFWGLLHGESERYDSTENIDSCLRHFRDEKSLNFYGASPFESEKETPADLWKSISQNCDEFDEDDRYAVFSGFQWQGDAKSEGLRHIIYQKHGKPILRKKEARSNSLKRIYKMYAPKEIISIPSFPMGKSMEYDFKNFNPEYERVVEIYNAWGSSECTKKEGNIYPICAEDKKGVTESKEGSILKALLQNKRFGFCAGGLDDRGSYNSFYDHYQIQYSPGLTAICADALSRQSLFEALFNRHCYATTGQRIIIGFSIAGKTMGSELSAIEKPGLSVNRHIVAYIAGTAPLHTVELIRNGKVLKTWSPDSSTLDIEYDDMEPLDKVALSKPEGEGLFSFYYIRVTQEDANMAWSSPIWVDSLGKETASTKKKNAKK